MIGLALGSVAYVWIAAVRAVPDVRRRKAAMRVAWRRKHLERRQRDRRSDEHEAGDRPTGE